MLFIHPIIQFLAIILAYYVFSLGLQRFRSLHWDHQIAFRWKRHVVLGVIALGALLSGMAGGLIMTYLYWRNYFITGLHAKASMVMAGLISFGVLSGLWMHFKKRKRKRLPVFHAINNLFLLFLCLLQIFTGWKILFTYILK